jgi:hypothetical protein
VELWVGEGRDGEGEGQAIAIEQPMPGEAVCELTHETDALAPGREVFKGDGSGSRCIIKAREGIEGWGVIFNGEDEFRSFLIFDAGGCTCDSASY